MYLYGRFLWSWCKEEKEKKLKTIFMLIRDWKSKHENLEPFYSNQTKKENLEPFLG